MLCYTAVAARGFLGAVAGSATLEPQQYCEEYMRDPGVDWTFVLAQDLIIYKIFIKLANCGFLFKKRKTRDTKHGPK